MRARRLVVAVTVVIAVTLPLSSVTMAVTVAANSTCSHAHPAKRQEQCDASLLPTAYPMTAMGYADFGGGPKAHVHSGIGVDRLRGPGGPAAHQFTLTAAMGTQDIGGAPRAVLTFNGTTPGPTLTVTQGDLVEVRLVNKDVKKGVTIHWHGVDVPAGEDGVAGVTQDAVLPGSDFVYRFVVPDAGTYWYHSHQDSVREVGMGLLGALIVLPRDPATSQWAGAATDAVALVHTYGTTTTVNGRIGTTYVTASEGTTARVRFINGDNGPVLVTASVPFRVAAIDGTDVPGATDLVDTYVDVPAGGRADLLIAVPPSSARVGVLGGPGLVIGPIDQPVAEVPAHQRFDALAYGASGGSAAAQATIGRPTRDFAYRIGSRTGYLDGRPGVWFTINAGIIPTVPMFVAHRGDVLRFRIVNTTAVVHPMHLHGHHALVVARNGVAATGAPWWIDSLQVDPGQSYDIVLVADNPGVWMFHCHNLPHARTGLMTHLMYDGVTTPFRIGRVNDRLTNEPE